jgi:hypothetical protein
MRAVLRLLILVPLGVIAGAAAASMMIFIFVTNVAEFAATFGAALLAAWNALWDAAFVPDGPQAANVLAARIGGLSMLVLFAPVAMTALIAEIARLRGALAHVVLAGALTILLPFAAFAPARALSAGEARVLACLFFTGVAAGLVYWLIAGRGREPALSAPAP